MRLTPHESASGVRQAGPDAALSTDWAGLWQVVIGPSWMQPRSGSWMDLVPCMARDANPWTIQERVTFFGS
jgi:hypothetical protein